MNFTLPFSHVVFSFRGKGDEKPLPLLAFNL